MKLKYYSFILITFLNIFVIPAQNSSIKITGTIIESVNNNPIEFATVAIFNKNSKKAIAGSVTDANGYFSINSTDSNIYIEISFIGFKTKKVTSYTVKNQKIDLKTIVLEENSQSLDEVLIRSEKSQTEFKLDRRVFNVGKDLSSTGAGALEVLNNVPSVNVDIEGQVSLRGNSGVQILINGKPSVLTNGDSNALGSITADMIEKIEVITNPSAKYDAEGTAGIINIVIKKSEKKGLNGSATLNLGVPNSNSFGLSLNKRTEKFNLFSQIGIGLRTYPSESESVNNDLVNDISVTSIGDGNFNEKFNNILLGTDYHINDLNVVTLSGSYAYEVEDQDNLTTYNRFNASNKLTDNWLRSEKTEATNPKLRYELQYKKNFKRHKEQSLLFSALGSSFRKDQFSDYENTPIIGDVDNLEQKTRTDYKLEDYTFKLDYTHPFLKKYTLESGSQYVINNVTNDFAVDNLTNGEWINDADLSNIFNYEQKVLGIYTTAAFEGDKWGLKVGLRMENTSLSTVLKTTNEESSDDYTNFFPSAHTSYTVNDNFSLQVGYSKRINRPRLRSLNPFSSIRNNFSISTGNPDLQPEYTDSYEITSIHKIGKTSLNFSLYNRHTTDVMERVSVFENNVSISRPENIGSNTTTGFEINGKIAPLSWLSINGDFNINYFNREGFYNNTSFDFKGNRWSTRLTSKIKLPAEFDIEISGDFRSKYKTVQQKVSSNLFADFGLRKKILKGKTILNISVRDVFASRIYESETIQPDFYLFNSRTRGRFITFGISYGFGKGEAMQFSGQRRR
ncbi:Outer membrane receptor for ferrienterochelin and colicins [Lutibacter oricola]|uniref:Outer membrane receptor for ferrienterochelin and colicins n=1 Tax=Lutibacter oricola TaxID=762486 RepID=A0A1H2WKL6_9FLAO|nr:outer membrane beta-barrel family protein [Lutibacter oricola]SDW81026.1 Outer membrane receptor for ferrienterochelin and colicins [Lutibacter oricola]